MAPNDSRNASNFSDSSGFSWQVTISLRNRCAMSAASVFPNSLRALRAVIVIASLATWKPAILAQKNPVAIIFVMEDIFENISKSTKERGVRMKTVLVHRPGGPEALDYTDAPMPTPGEREVLIRAKAFGVGQPDKLIRSGVYKWMPPLPANPGNDVAGEIEAVGSLVTGISVG